MKITIIGTAHPYRGGLASYNERLGYQFVDEGDDLEIITFTLQYPKLFFPGKSQFTNSPPPENLRIKRLLSSVNPLSWIKTAREVAARKPDLVIFKYWHPSMSPSFGSVIRLIKRKSPNTKIITVFDNVIPHERKPGYGLLTSFFTNSIDGAVVMSRSVGTDLESFRKDIPVAFNPHPLFDNYGERISRESARSKLALSMEQNVFLFFGFIRAYKGLDLLLQAVCDERLREKNIKVIVAGEFYEDDAPYKRIIKENDLSDMVILMDRFIGDEEVATLFCAADMIVQPYRSATQSGVTQIAYHFGRPMLVTDVGGLAEIVPHGKCGYVVAPEPVAIADALVDFIDNNREARFAKCVDDEREKYGWDRLTATIRNLYDSL